MAVAPTVSVIIPAYNVAPYIGETLDSLLAQSFTDYEVLLINDGSTDQTEQVVLSYRAKFGDRLTYECQSNRGIAGARNAGLFRARGRYIALLDSDDLWLPDYLAKMVALIESDPTFDLVFPNAWFWGSPNFSGREFQSVFPARAPVTFEKVLPSECYILGWCCSNADYLTPSAALMKNSARPKTWTCGCGCCATAVALGSRANPW
jgi:glycosyltransferase involved in cell wall biosynthesis